MDGDETLLWNLEQLLPATPEDEPMQDDRASWNICTASFEAKLRETLSAIPKYDPLLVTATQAKRCLPELKGEPFTIQEIPGKGMGVVAIRRIPKGNIILSDPFAISVKEPTKDPFPDYESNSLFGKVVLQLLEQYVQLPLQKRNQFASLHPHMEPESRPWLHRQLSLAAGGAASDILSQRDLDFIVRLYFTFTTNEFSKLEPGRCGMWTVRRLFLLTARINHSCRPNARSRQTTDGYKVVTAMRDIEVGEEILLKYCDHVRFTRKEWQATTQRAWGFVCDCEGCSAKM